MAKRPLYLEQWFNPTRAAELKHNPTAFDPAKYRDNLHARLAREVATATIAREIPRRLGQAATPDDLARDKRFCKLYKNRMISLLTANGGNPQLPVHYEQAHPDEVRANAAQRDWHEYLPNHFAHNNIDLETIAAYGLHPTNAPIRKEFNHLANCLFNEIIQISQIYYATYPENAGNLHNKTLEILKELHKLQQ